MELHCLPAETPTRASSSATDPLYDNYCPPYAQKGTDRHKEKETESSALCPAVTRLSNPHGPQPALAPAVAEVPTLVGGGRGPGAWPEHSYCSWRVGLGRQGWEAELPPDINTARGRDRGAEGVRGEVQNRGEERVYPGPSQSEAHTSALSVYDNLPEAVTPDSDQEIMDMDTNFQWQGQLYQAWAPELIQGPTEGDRLSEEKSSWSSCEIILAGSESSNQDPNPDQQNNQEPEPEPASEPERDSGSCSSMLHPQLPVSPPQPQLAASPPQMCQGGCQGFWAREEAQHQEQPAWAPRDPPPVPLADPSASALRSLLTNLHQQIGRQREEYEERITGLEQRNEELQVEVIRLRTNLIQQRHWYQAVQAKIVESERARAAAELRNAALQKEMEQFFDTFGELNNEAKKTECIVKGF